MIETQELELKKPKFEDWESIYINLWLHDESAKYMLWRPVHNEEEAKEKMQKNIAFMEKNILSWFIYEKRSNEVIGFAGMEQIEDGVYEDSGIAIGPLFISKGYGKQILKALCDEAFNTYGAYKFVCFCRSGNIASKQLQLLLGFCYTHSIEKEDARNGEKYILDFYELLR
ncbi:MAG TPA: GNAT family protein [Lachnospiraceae bacterium]|nr:GNAT family protein [Lachnospiraceae bacterium]